MKIRTFSFTDLKTVLVLILVLTLSACSSNDDGRVIIDLPMTEDDLLKQVYFNSSSLLTFEKVPCTLENGSESECYRLVFTSNPIPGGPFCPETIDEVGGLAFYDGNTNPGFQVVKASLFNAMENDGYDIVSSSGDIYIDDFTTPPNPGGFSYCLEALPDDNLQLTFLIPAEPVMATSNNSIDTVELIGVSIDGVPINGDPPSVVNGPVFGVANVPALDPCGGHHDPAGYYHKHFVSEIMNQVLDANGINDVSCTLVAQVSTSKLIGFAKDGYPIYAYQTEPEGLDECGGIEASTTEFPNGVYHYVASTTEAPNVPVCLKGVAAINSFSFQ